MSSPRTIVHLDADACYASVEQAADPRLRGKVLAVGGQARGSSAAGSSGAPLPGVTTQIPTPRARGVCPAVVQQATQNRGYAGGSGRLPRALAAGVLSAGQPQGARLCRSARGVTLGAGSFLARAPSSQVPGRTTLRARS